MFLTAELKRKLNSATKYPKIPTFHYRDGKGNLAVDHWTYPSKVYVHEKIDGENTRITVLPTGEYLIGGRDEWLTVSGDRMWNEKDGLVEAVRPFADLAIQAPMFFSNQKLTTFYVEVYGHKATNSWQNYGGGLPGVRLFDISKIDIDILDESIEAIAAWRENASHDGVWADQESLEWSAQYCGFTTATRLDVVDSRDLPTSIEGMREFLYQWPTTTAAISGTPGRNEGVVFSDFNRKLLTKAKFRDYDKWWNALEEENRLAEKAERKAAFEAGRRGE